MIESAVKFLGIYFLCLFKFIAGPILGYAAGYSLFEIMAVTVMGMMSSVFLFSFLGDWAKKQLGVFGTKKGKVFSKRSRKTVIMWRRYGAAGVAFLTPLILTPIGGTLVMISFGVDRKLIIGYMLISAIAWSFILGLSIEQILKIEPLNALFR